jgi:hypothetical protein
MPLYRLGQKFDYDDDIVIVSKTKSRRIIFVLQDIGTNGISGEMLKNPPRNKQTKTNAQKQPPVEDTKSKTLQNKSQVTTPRKRG